MDPKGIGVTPNNNPVNVIDPDGGSPPSTHTDADGKVVAVYNDGDLGVYMHDDLSGWDGKSILSSTGSGVTKMGTTLFWDEFLNFNTGLPEGVIIYDDRYEASWNSLIESMHEEASKRDLSRVAEMSRNNQRYDIKTNKAWAGEGIMIGRLLNGHFATVRSAGNFLAGYNGRTGTFQGKHVTLETYMKLAGALQTRNWSSSNAADIFINGTSYGPPPYYGEQPYSGRMIIQGWNYGNR